MKATQRTFKLVTITVIVVAFAGAMAAGSGGKVYAGDLVKSIIEKFNAFYSHAAQDRLYVQTDKTYYKPGETIWFTAYVRDAQTFKPSNNSDIIHVELITPKGTTEAHYKIQAKEGSGRGDFDLTGHPGGIYKLKAYTELQKNEDSVLFFEKEITIQNVVMPRLKMKLDFEKKAYGKSDEVTAKLELNTNAGKPLANSHVKFKAQLDGKDVNIDSTSTDGNGKTRLRFTLPADLNTTDGVLNVMIDFEGSTESISRSIPIVLNKIKVEFFPEGGDLVTGYAAKVAFRATNEFNKPADMEGILVDSKGAYVTRFSSYHFGMGTFEFTPRAGETYKARITKPAGILDEFNLPEALDAGYVLSLSGVYGDSLHFNIQSFQPDELSFIAQTRGKIYAGGTFKAAKGNNSLAIGMHDFPIGISQVTLFDGKGIERCERLVFVNKSKQLKVSVSADKTQYKPREPVNMTVKVTDANGLPMPGNFSLSVVDDNLLSFADDKQGNILSKMLLEPELKQKVEEPNFYFDPKEPKADRALDLLMMTSGWRHYTWKRIMDGAYPPARHMGEKYQNNDLFTEDGRNPNKIRGQQTQTREKADAARFPQAAPNGAMEMAQVKVQALRAAGAAPEMEDLGDILARPLAMDNEPDPVKPDMNGAVEEAQFNDGRGVALMGYDKQAERMGKAVVFYRAKEFPVRKYEADDLTRNDFGTTVYWNGDVNIDHSGKAKISFLTNDLISSFKATLEGFAVDGSIGRGEDNYTTNQPFAMDIKMPAELVCGDKMTIPVFLKNSTALPIIGKVQLTGTPQLQLDNKTEDVVIPANGNKVLHVAITATSQCGDGSLEVKFMSDKYHDNMVRPIHIAAKGFPANISIGGQDLDKEFVIHPVDVVPGSLKVSFKAYPNIMSELMNGVASILREPNGCFEQTSSSNYPNILALQYLKTMDVKDPDLQTRAMNLLDKGYKKLTSFETKENGYEWFGASPPHEALTAYGLMEFKDMQKVYSGVDPQMVSRTANLLLNRKDGEGGFKKNPKAIDAFGRADEDITNAYIVYALSEAGYKDVIKKESDAVYKSAKSTNDPYIMALCANTLFNIGELNRAEEMILHLLDTRNEANCWTGKKHSITRSTGESLKVETTSLALLAMLKSPNPEITAITGAVKFLVGARSGAGGFGSTQATILALKALTAYAEFNRQTDEAGTAQIYVNGITAGSKDYAKGEKHDIVIMGLEKFINDGQQKIEVRFKGCSKALPYAMNIEYNTNTPKSSKECAVNITTSLSATEAKVGETLRLSATLKNVTATGQPMTMAVIGLPAGFSAQPWQLKEMMEKGTIDFYETTGNSIAFYYRQLAANAEKQINLDLKAEVPGEYDAPASTAYLYYTNELKSWVGLSRIRVLN